MKIKKFTTLIELMIMIPIFTIGIYGAIYFGEVTMSRINGSIASRYVSESSDNISNDDLASLFTTERGKKSIDNGGEHFWATESEVNIYTQLKGKGSWPRSENGSNGNVIHEYLIEYGFDVVNDYELVGNSLERTTSFTHPPGGLDLLRWQLWIEADVIIERVLQERITYSDSTVNYKYNNDQIMPGSYDQIAKGEVNKARDKISFSNEGRNLILLKNTATRDFYLDMTSIDKLTDSSEFSKGVTKPLSDERYKNAVLETGEGSTELDIGEQNISFTNNDKIRVRDKYPFGRSSVLVSTYNNNSTDQSASDETIIKIGLMGESVNKINSDFLMLPNGSKSLMTK
ncbi:MAG: hypothetical protein COA79_00150 [Planctomycetota bacterium]|nr:MAG: hypothetical protein COA79_00150 [Planctomycetota bacterium]